MNDYTDNDIIRYLDGDMDAAGKAAFEQAMREDPNLRKQVEEWQTVTDGLKDNELRETRERVRQFEHKAKPFPYLKIAAAIIILFVTGLLLYQWKPYDYHNYFEPYPNVVQSRGFPAGAIDAAMQAYTGGNYEKAIAGLIRLEKTDTINFYLGNAYLFHGEPALAGEFLLDVQTDGSLFSQQAEWLRVKALLDQDQQQEAGRLLESIRSNPDHSYQAAASKLYEDMF